MGTSRLIDPDIILEIFNGYSLPILGLHGIAHWGRVLETGQRLAAQNGADIQVVKYFAIFHDSRRTNEGEDPMHGYRGAQLVEKFKSKLNLTEFQLEELKYSCRNHTNGTTKGSLTVRTCWDSDRLDLWRVGTRPSKQYLCTEAGKGKDIQEWSKLRCIEEYVPECSREWLRLFETN